MDLGLKGKVALVTGSSQGIGLAVAVGLAKEGCDVAMCAWREDALKAAAEQVRTIGVRVAAIPADVLKSEDASRFVEQAAAELGGIDILVNNAGKNIGSRAVGQRRKRPGRRPRAARAVPVALVREDPTAIQTEGDRSVQSRGRSVI